METEVKDYTHFKIAKIGVYLRVKVNESFSSSHDT
jgi:hypothetical protein